MKKGLLTLLTILITAAMLVACGSSIPKGMSEKTYDCGIRALEIMEQYNSEDITKDEADAQLNKIQDELIDESKTIAAEYEGMNYTLSGYIIIFNSGNTDVAVEALRKDLGK